MHGLVMQTTYILVFFAFSGWAPNNDRLFCLMLITTMVSLEDVLYISAFCLFVVRPNKSELALIDNQRKKRQQVKIGSLSIYYRPAMRPLRNT